MSEYDELDVIDENRSNHLGSSSSMVPTGRPGAHATEAGGATAWRHVGVERKTRQISAKSVLRAEAAVPLRYWTVPNKYCPVMEKNIMTWTSLRKELEWTLDSG
jgi:hypothetical protein